MFFATYVSKLLLFMSGKVCNRFPRRRYVALRGAERTFSVNRPSRKAKVEGKHSWYSSYTRYVPHPKLPFVKYRCNSLQLLDKTTAFARNLSANY